MGRSPRGTRLTLAQLPARLRSVAPLVDRLVSGDRRQNVALLVADFDYDLSGWMLSSRCSRQGRCVLSRMPDSCVSIGKLGALGVKIQMVAKSDVKIEPLHYHSSSPGFGVTQKSKRPRTDQGRGVALTLRRNVTSANRLLCDSRWCD